MAGPAASRHEACYPGGLLGVEQARAFLLERARPIAEVERVPTEQALGRVLAREQSAPIDVPTYDNSAMDGYALRSADASRQGPVRLQVTQRIAAGGAPAALGPGEAARIFTGAPLPPGADTVVMQEACETQGETVVVPGPVEPGRHVRPRGNDIVAGARVLAAGTRIRPQEMGLVASVGLAELGVVRRPQVAIFSTGDELATPGERLGPGCIYNSNRYTLLGLLAGLGCETLDLGVIEDSLEATREALQRCAAQTDLVVTSGGVSVGEEDHVRAALAQVGQLELWQIAIKPGKPLAYGRIGDADFLGLPGNPVSTLVTFCLFVRPFLLRRLGVQDVFPQPTPVRAGFEWPRSKHRREYLRARLETDGARGSVAVLYPRQGSDVLSSATWAQGLVEIPEGARLAAGDELAYYPFSELLC